MSLPVPLATSSIFFSDLPEPFIFIQAPWQGKNQERGGEQDAGFCNTWTEEKRAESHAKQSPFYVGDFGPNIRARFILEMEECG